MCPKHRDCTATDQLSDLLPGTTYIAGLWSHHHTKIPKVTIGEREHRHQGLEAMINKGYTARDIIFSHSSQHLY